jgi:type IV pilus assembly protein PilB
MRIEDFMGWGGERIDLATVHFTPELLSRVPRHLALKYRVLPVFASGERLSVVVAGPPDFDVVDSITHLLQREVEFRPADEQQLDTFIQRLYICAEQGHR